VENFPAIFKVLNPQRPLTGCLELIDISLDYLFAFEANDDEGLALGHLANFP